MPTKSRLSKRLYKEKNISEETSQGFIKKIPNISSEDDMIEYFSVLSSINAQYPNFHIEYNYSGFYKVLLILISKVETIYSERINFNPILQEFIQEKLVPYYLGRFDINMSREISFLPYELRIYYYTELLKKETNYFMQYKILNRLTQSLFKAGEKDIGYLSLFIYSWSDYTINKFIYRKKSPFNQTIIKNEITFLENVIPLQKRILQEANMTAEFASNEFYYGLKAFFTKESIHNFNAAKLFFHLFYLYYSNNFAVMHELNDLAYRYFNTEGRHKELELLNSRMDELGLNDIQLINKYYTGINDYNALNLTEKVNVLQKNNVNEKTGAETEKSSFILNYTSRKPDGKIDFNKIPNEINFEDRQKYYNLLKDMLNLPNVSITEFSRLLFKIIIAIMKGKNWDSRYLSFESNLLFNINKFIWKRFDKHNSYANYMLTILLNFFEKEYLEENQSWPIGICCDYNRNDFSIIYSKKINTPLYWGEIEYDSSQHIIPKEKDMEKRLYSMIYITNFLGSPLLDEFFSRNEKKTLKNNLRTLQAFRKEYCK